MVNDTYPIYNKLTTAGLIMIFASSLYGIAVLIISLFININTSSYNLCFIPFTLGLGVFLIGVLGYTSQFIDS
jgi:hypothetical protein